MNDPHKLAANPCPCGRWPRRGNVCECTPTMVTRYQVCLSGPLLDRVDLRVEVDAVSRTALLQQRDAPAESSAMVAARVLAARERAAARYADAPWRLNGEVPGHELRTRYPSARRPGATRNARWNAAS